MLDFFVTRPFFQARLIVLSSCISRRNILCLRLEDCQPLLFDRFEEEEGRGLGLFKERIRRKTQYEHENGEGSH